MVILLFSSKNFGILLGATFCNEVLQIMNRNASAESINCRMPCLIPNSSSGETFNDFRPISLINVMSMVFFKIWVNMASELHS